MRIKIRSALIVVPLSLLSLGCAHTLIDSNQRGEDINKHVLRVSPHGYLIKNDITRLPAWKRKPNNYHLNIGETREAYGEIIKGAMTLSCERLIPADREPTEVELEEVRVCARSAEELIEWVIKGKDNNDKEEFFDAFTIREKFVNHFIERGRPLKIMVYFHGGLNNYKKTDERLGQIKYIKSGKSAHEEISPDSKWTNHWQYPVYVSWPSEFFGTYGEHLFSMREGRREETPKGLVSSLVVAFEDVVTSGGEFLSNAYYQFSNDRDRYSSLSGYGLSSVWSEAFVQFTNIDCRDDKGDARQSNDYIEDDPRKFVYKKAGNIHINRSVYKYGSLPYKVKSGGFILFSPIRYPVGSLWNGVVAENSWRIMKRRARNMFDPTGDADYSMEKSPDFKDGIGSSLGSFFETLLDLKAAFPKLDLQLTLVGHSMGTIAINNLLEKYNTGFKEFDVITNIVYMAAAASTEETLSIVPEIMREDDSLNFYNLTLNRVSEVAENYCFGAGPSGSLLVSIDKYHDQPEHHLKRTFGSEVNVHSSLPAIFSAFEGVKGKVVLKSFNDLENPEPGAENRLPRQHGDFGDLDFWLPSSWEIRDEQGSVPTLSVAQCDMRVLRPYTKPKHPKTAPKGTESDVLSFD